MRKLLVLGMSVLIVMSSVAVLDHFEKLQAQRMADNAESNAKTYADNTLAGQPFLTTGMDAQDTFELLNSDSTDTARFFWQNDSFFIEINGGDVYIPDLLDIPNADSLDSALARIAVLEAELDTLDVNKEIKWVYCYASQDTIDLYNPGWWLCDGNNGTPNLLNRVIVGAGGVYATGDTGGDTLVALTVNGHTHTISAEAAHKHLYEDSALVIRYAGAGTPVVVPEMGTVPDSTSAGTSHNHGGTTGSGSESIDDVDVRQPYYGLVPIMRKKYGS